MAKKKVNVFEYIISNNERGVYSFFKENNIDFNRDTNMANLLQAVIIGAKDRGGFRKLAELHPDKELLTQFGNRESQYNNADGGAEVKTVPQEPIAPPAENKPFLDPKMTHVVTGIGITLAFIGIVVAITKK